MKQIPNPYERRRIAEMVRVSPAYLYQCLTGRRDIDPTEAVRIEQETGGVISRFDVCMKRGKDIWPEIWAARANIDSAVADSMAVKPAHSGVVHMVADPLHGAKNFAPGTT